MEDKKTLGCKGMDCGCGHKSLLCWVIGFVVLIIVFCAGFKLGEWKSYFYEQGYYGYPGSMMRWGYPEPGYGYGMMRGGWRTYDTSLPTEQTTTETTNSATNTEK